MKAWLARDETEGYSLWLYEPCLFKVFTTNKTKFINTDHPESYTKVQPQEFKDAGFPALQMNTIKQIDINKQMEDYFFLF